jgi:hypothetical protein
MGPFIEKISDVKVYRVIAGTGENGQTVYEPFSLLVRWRSGYVGKCYQIYINGKMVKKITDSKQRNAVVTYSCLHVTAAKVSVCAVEPKDVNVDYSREFMNLESTGQVHISWARGLYLPYKGKAEVFSNDGIGNISYDSPEHKFAIPLWPIWQDQSGWGMSKFGKSDFGYDSSAAAGFGQGAFGFGEHGFDAVKQKWSSGRLKKGKYKYSIQVYDANGCTARSTETDEIVVTALPEPCEKLVIEDYDKTQNEIVFKFD